MAVLDINPIETASKSSADEKCIEHGSSHGGPPAPGEAPLHRKLKSRHLQMIAIGGTAHNVSAKHNPPPVGHVLLTSLETGIIGPGLLVGSGNALHLAGPAGILISFSLVGILVFFVMCAELPLSANRPLSNDPMY